MESHEPSAARAEGAASKRETAFVFERHIARVGTLRVRPMRLPEDMPVVHSWVSQEYARYWGLVGCSLAQATSAYADILRSAEVFLGYRDDAPAFLIERYLPGQHAVGEHYAVQSGDRGMHVLVAPAEQPIPGFTWSVFSTVMDFLFADPATERIVVEPDIRNTPIHALNRRAGFRYRRAIELPNKVGHLAFCTRAQYLAERERRQVRVHPDRAPAAEAPAAHLQPEIWSAVNRALVCKAVAELAHERVLVPRLERAEGEWAHYVLAPETGETQYRFRARRLELDCWDIDPGSLQKRAGGAAAPLDALDFVLEFRAQLGMDAELLPVYLEEISSTLYAAAFKHARTEPSAADLVHAEFQEIEAAMTEGHPAFIANSGRVGFDAADYFAYAPEVGSEVQLVWLAAHSRHTEFSSADGLTYERLMAEELGAETIAAWNRELSQLGLDPRAYLFIPVHPWQWWNKLALIFAADIATRDLVCLGYSPDSYRAQQSIRTFFNLSRPERRYVKTALSILNMGFMRGLSADYMRGTPAINDFIHALLTDDPYFARQGFRILREVAGIGYRNPCFETLAKQSPYRKLLAALWRESPVPQLQPGQRLMTMAALLHRDRDGHALLPQLIAASGIGIDAWLDRYLGCYLAPLLHCFYRYQLAFMPHGENVILVLEGHVPVGALMKDIAEEAVIMDGAFPLPERVARMRAEVPERIKLLSIFTDVFDGIFRYLAQILLDQAAYAEQRFWERVAACVLEYQRAHPELAASFDRYDMFAPEFLHSCLNRLQLQNNQQMIDLADPAKNLKFAGTLSNPIARNRTPSAPQE